MTLDISTQRKVPEGQVGIINAAQFSRYSLTVDLASAATMLGNPLDPYNKGDSGEFLEKLDRDIRQGNVLSIHVPNRTSQNPIKFGGVTLELALSGSSENFSAQQRHAILSEISDLMIKKYEFKKVTFLDPQNGRSRVEINQEV